MAIEFSDHVYYIVKTKKFVSQNYGAGNRKRIRQGVRAGLIQTQAWNVLMGVGILLLREPIVASYNTEIERV